MKCTIKIFFTVLPLITLVTSTKAQTELQQIDSVIHVFYTTLSFTDGQWKDAEKLKEIMFADSRFIANFGSVPQVWTIDQYIESTRANVLKQGTNVVEEREVYSETDVFGKVAQRLSTYEIRFRSNDKENVRSGINFIQLIKVDGSWKVNALVWDRESPELSIPSQYKAKKN